MISAKPETTETKDRERPAAGWVFYDGDCRLCQASVARFEPWLGPRGFLFVPLQSAWAREKLGMEEGDPLLEMIVLTRDGQRFGGADAVLHLASAVPGVRPFAWLAGLPGARRLSHWTYRRIAERRHCAAGACALPGASSGRPRARWMRHVTPVVPAAIVLAAGAAWPPWVWMWSLALAVFFGCKLAMWIDRAGVFCGQPLRRRGGFLFLWVGMDPRPFLRDGPPSLQVAAGDWLRGGVGVFLGLALLLFGVPAAAEWDPLAAGWAGMIGLTALLHFGLFHWLAMAWRTAGVPVEPIMNRPLRSRGLGEFWSRRWNLGFTDLANRLVFEPLWRKTGPAGATLAVFAVSGLVHDLVISIPARGGHGGPLAYFLLQGGGVLLERSRVGKRHLHGWAGRLFAGVMVVAPLGLLFHPPFVRNVILPFLEAIGCL